MSGRIVHESTTPPPPAPHWCDPPAINNYGVWQHNPGTVWECDCGKQWIAGQDRKWHRELGRWRHESMLASSEGTFASMIPSGGSPPPDAA